MNKQETEYIIEKYLNEIVYRIAKVEIPTITHDQTTLILENKEVKNSDLNENDIISIKNIFKDFNYMCQTLEEKISVDKILFLHDTIANHQALESGVIRYGDVTISGVEYLPPSPREIDLEQLFEKEVNILKEQYLKHPIEAAIDYLLIACRNQFFWDGNKRTAFMVANYILLQTGNGTIGIDEKINDCFSMLLSEYYETGKKEKIAKFLYEQCLKTFGFELNNGFDINYFLVKDKL